MRERATLCHQWFLLFVVFGTDNVELVRVENPFEVRQDDVKGVHARDEVLERRRRHVRAPVRLEVHEEVDVVAKEIHLEQKTEVGVVGVTNWC